MAADATRFAALVDEAAAVQPAPPAAAADVNLFTDWWLTAPDVLTTFEELRAGVARAEEGDVVDAPAENDEDEEAAEPSLEGVLNIEWLFARPQRLVNLAPEQERAAKSENGAGEKAPAPEAMSASKPVALATAAVSAEPIVAAAANVPAIGSTKAEASDAQAMSTLPMEPEAAPAEPMADEAVELQAPRAPEPVVKVAKAWRVAPEVLVEKVTAEAQVQAQVQMPRDVTAREAVVREPEPSAEQAPRPNAAGSRFAKAIERLSGGREQMPVDRPLSSPQDASTDSQARGFSPSPPQHEAGANVQVRAQTPAPVFSVPATPDSTRTIDVNVRPVEVPSSPVQIPEADTLRQIVQTMRMQFKDGIGDAVVKLRPEHLGEVSISLRVEQQSVSATVQADVAAVRHWLESHETSLRNGLAEQGLHLEKFVVRQDDGRQQSEAEEQQARQRGRRQGRRNAEDDPKFEVTV